jgi:uncharacterized protein YbjQ (UPF0145 family)
MALLDILIVLGLIVLGFVFGQLAEQRHFRSIRRRESETRDLLCFSERFPPPDAKVRSVDLVAGNVAISIDYFKRVTAGLRMLYGGRVRAYESLLERARREAILRMKEEAIRKGAKSVFNVKIETSSISKGGAQQIGSVEVIVYGTALIE